MCQSTTILMLKYIYIYISTFKCQDLQVLPQEISCFCWSACWGNNPFIHPFIHSSIHPFIHSSIHSKCKAFVCLHGYGTGRTRRCRVVKVKGGRVEGRGFRAEQRTVSACMTKFSRCQGRGNGKRVPQKNGAQAPQSVPVPVRQPNCQRALYLNVQSQCKKTSKPSSQNWIFLNRLLQQRSL